MIMHIKGIAGAAYSGRTKSSARIPTLLRHLLIASRQQLADTMHLFTGMKGLLFINIGQQCTSKWTQGKHVDLCLPVFYLCTSTNKTANE